MSDFSIQLKDFSKENVFILFSTMLIRIAVSGVVFYMIGILINRDFIMADWNLFSQMMLSVFFTFSVALFVLMAIEHDEKI